MSLICFIVTSNVFKTLVKGLDIETRPEQGQIVTILCTGRLKDGQDFFQNNRMTYTLGDGDVIQGLLPNFLPVKSLQ